MLRKAKILSQISILWITSEHPYPCVFSAPVHDLYTGDVAWNGPSAFSPYCRYMLGLSVVPAVLQFIGFIFLPESPRWLLKNGRSQEAREVLSRIRGGRNIDAEYNAIRTNIEEEEKEAGGERILWKVVSRCDKTFFIQTLERHEGTWGELVIFICII